MVTVRIGRIRITVERWLFFSALTLLGLLAVAGLALLGRAYTPHPARLVGWSDWQALGIERQYRRELAALRADASELAGMLRQRPDPLRAETAAARLTQRHARGLDVLAYQRESVVAAAEAVRAWAAGYETYDSAVTAANAALESLDGLGGDDDGDGRTSEWWAPGD
jgi:hypothetical protein